MSIAQALTWHQQKFGRATHRGLMFWGMRANQAGNSIQEGDEEERVG